MAEPFAPAPPGTALSDFARRNPSEIPSQTQSVSAFLPRSLSDIDRSTAANDPRPSASCSARKNPQCIPANTPPVFPGLRPRIWPHLLRLVTKAMSDRLLARIIHDGSSRKRVPREAYLVKREALAAGAKHVTSDSGTKYASRTTFTNQRRFTRNSSGSAIAAEVLMNNAG